MPELLSKVSSVPPGCRGRAFGQISVIEVLVCLAVITALLLPLYSLIVRGQTTTFRSRLAFLAVQVAREEIEDVIVLAGAQGNDPTKLAHRFRPVAGGLLDRLSPLVETGRTARPAPEYPAEYRRIFTRLAVEPSRDPRIHTALLEVRWQERGEDPAAGAEVSRLQRFDFYLVRPRRGKP